MEARWRIFYVASILQLIFSGLLMVNIIYQAFSQNAVSNIPWVAYLMIAMTLVLLLHSILSIHILHRYYPDRIAPVSLTRSRALFTFLSWISVIILSVALSTIVSDNKSWKNLNLLAWLIITALIILTLVSLASLILQNGLIKRIRKNHETHLTESINMIGESAYQND